MGTLHSLVFITADGHRSKMDLDTSSPHVTMDTKEDVDANHRGFVELEWQTDTGKLISYTAPVDRTKRSYFCALPTRDLRHMFVVYKNVNQRQTSIAKVFNHEGIEILTIGAPERLTPDQYHGRSRKFIGEHDVLGEVLSFSQEGSKDHMMLVFFTLGPSTGVEGRWFDTEKMEFDKTRGSFENWG